MILDTSITDLDRKIVKNIYRCFNNFSVNIPKIQVFIPNAATMHQDWIKFSTAQKIKTKKPNQSSPSSPAINFSLEAELKKFQKQRSLKTEQHASFQLFIFQYKLWASSNRRSLDERKVSDPTFVIPTRVTINFHKSAYYDHCSKSVTVA